VLQSGAGNLGGIQHTLLDEVAVLTGSGVVAVVAFAVGNIVDHDAGLFAGVGNNGAQGSFNSAQDQLDAGFLVDVVALDLGDGSLGADQCNTAARNNTLFDGCARSVQGVFDAGFLFLHFDFGGSTNANHGNTACQLGNALLQFLAVVVRSRFFDLNADLLDASFDRLAVAGAVDDDGVLFAHFDALGLTQLLERGVFERTTGLFGNNGTAGKDGDVFQHGLATIAEARSLDSSGLEDATDVVDNQSGQGFAFHVFSDDEQRTAGFCNLLQNRQQIANVADLLVVDQDIGIFQNGNLLVLVVDEVGRQVAAVELHAFDDVQLVFERFAVFNGDHAFLANFVHCVGNDLADGLVAVGRDGANLSDFLAGGAGTRDFLQLFDSNGNSLVDTALQVHGVDAGGNVLQTFFDDGLGQYGSGSGTATSVVGGFGSNFLDQLRT